MMKIKQIKQEIKRLTRINNYYVFLRLISFILMLIALYLGVNQHQNYYFLMLITLFLFILFVINNQHNNNQLQHQKYLLQTYLDNDARKNDTWKTFKDDGSDMIQEDQYTCIDLDLLGPNSLFQYLSIAKTTLGRKNLAKSFLEVEDKQQILKKQAMIEELSQNEDLIMNLIAYLKAIKFNKKQEFNFEPIKLTSIFIEIIWILFVILHIISLIYMFVFNGHYAYSLIAYVGLLSLSLLMQLKHNHLFHSYCQLYEDVKVYDQFFKQIVNHSFKDDELIKLQEKAKKCYQASKALNQFLWLIHSRNNLIFYLLANGFLGIDLFIVRLLHHWYQQYITDFKQHYEVIAQYEILISYANLANVKKQTCIPTISDDIHLEFNDLYHPLINENKVQANSFNSNHNVIMISGSNMSGKTTFMRTIGINLVLFLNGARICASSANFSLFHIYTSIKINDNLSEGISTFYQEILRMKQIVEKSKIKQPTLILIDEIFKGTNYDDRILCSKTIIDLLHQDHLITMITTHDFALCEIDYVDNYHFNQTFDDQKMIFDYQIKKGINKNSNALALLHMVGID